MTTRALSASTSFLDTLRANLLKATPQPKLHQFFKALMAGATATGGSPPTITRPTNTLVNLGVFGDSVGNSKPQFITRRLIRALGNPAVGQAGGFFNTPQFTGGAAQNNDLTTSTYCPWTTHYTVPAGGTLNLLQGGGRPTCTKHYVWYYTGPGEGTFKVQVNSGAGYADVAGYTNVNAYSAAPGMNVITLPLAYGANSCQVIGLTGTVHIGAAGWINETDGGLAVWDMSVGGTALAPFNVTVSAVKAAIYNTLNLDIAFMEFKDGSEWCDQGATPGSLNTFLDWYRANVTNPTDWVLIATTPESSETTGASSAPANNAWTKAYADAHGLAFFDAYALLGSYANLVTYGWQGDGTHLSTPCSAYQASVLWNWLGFESLVEIPSGRDWIANGSVPQGYTLKFGGSILNGMPLLATFGTDSYGLDFIIKASGRTIAFQDNAGTNRGMFCANNNWPTWSFGPAISLIAPYATSGPALRAIGSAQGSGSYSSDASPGDGSAISPFAASEYRVGTNSSSGVRITSGSGSPQGVVSAPVGSLYLRTDGAAGSTLYVKESGTGNTGWAAK